MTDLTLGLINELIGMWAIRVISAGQAINGNKYCTFNMYMSSKQKQEPNKGKKSARLLLVTGIMTIAVVHIVDHYEPLRNLYNGVFTGIGIGLMLLALMQWKRWHRTGK